MFWQFVCFFVQMSEEVDNKKWRPCILQNSINKQTSRTDWNIAQLVKRVNGFEKYKKWAILDHCFSFNKPTKQEILHFLGWLRPKFCTKLFPPHFLKTSLAKIEANVQKSLKGGSVKADFLHGEKIDRAEKKALNSNFNWGPLHGETRLLK